MNDIKAGSVVFLNSYPDMKFTVTADGGSVINVIGYNKDSQEFVTLIRLSKSAFTLSK